MKRIFLSSILLLLLCGGMQAQVRMFVNGSQSFVLDEANGVYFHNDSLTVDGVSFALEDVQVITFQAFTGIADIKDIESLELLPNPVSDIVTLRGLGNESQTVTIYSTAGIKLMEQQAADGAVINISHLPEGVYILRCGNRVAKMVKQL